MLEKTKNKTILKSIFVILLFTFYAYITGGIMDILGIRLTKDNVIFISVISDLLLVLLLFIIYRKDLINEFNIYKPNYKNFFKDNLKYWYIGLIIMSLSNLAINYITSNNMPQNEEIVRSMINSFPVYGFFSVVIIAPFTEELVFRKTFKDIIKNKYILMIVSGLAFGLIHVIGAYERAIDFLYVIPYGVFGCVFSYMYYKTNTVFTSIFIHMFHNALLLVMGIISTVL